MAIPVAASVQIAIREWWHWRRSTEISVIAPPGTEVELPPPRHGTVADEDPDDEG